MLWAMMCYGVGSHFHCALGEGLIRFLTMFLIGVKEMDTPNTKDPDSIIIDNRAGISTEKFGLRRVSKICALVWGQHQFSVCR